jgi:hypothetical protein
VVAKGRFVKLHRRPVHWEELSQIFGRNFSSVSARASDAGCSRKLGADESIMFGSDMDTPIKTQAGMDVKLSLRQERLTLPRTPT